MIRFVLGYLYLLAGFQVIGIYVPIAVPVVLPDYSLSVCRRIDLIVRVAHKSYRTLALLPQPNIPVPFLVILVDDIISSRARIDATRRIFRVDLFLVDRPHIDHPAKVVLSQIGQVVCAKRNRCSILQTVDQLRRVIGRHIKGPDRPVIRDIILVLWIAGNPCDDVSGDLRIHVLVRTCRYGQLDLLIQAIDIDIRVSGAVIHPGHVVPHLVVSTHNRMTLVARCFADNAGLACRHRD